VVETTEMTKEETIETLKLLGETVTHLHNQNKLQRTAGRIEGTAQTVDKLRQYLPAEVKRKLANRAIAARAVINQKIAEEETEEEELTKKLDDIIRRLERRSRM